MPSVKLHIYRAETGNDGTESCDFRGHGELGAGEDDQHRTVLEVDPASDGLVDSVIEFGPKANQAFEALREAEPAFVGHLASALGLEGHGSVGLRLGVWDK